MRSPLPSPTSLATRFTGNLPAAGGATPDFDAVPGFQAALREIPAQYPKNGDAVAAFLSEAIRKAGEFDPKFPSRPRVRGFISGPPGSGKTTFVDRLGKVTGRPVVYIPMCQFQDSQSQFRIIGLPPGYVGTGLKGSVVGQLKELLDKVPDASPPILCLDEPEKASWEVQNVLKKILETGKINIEGQELDLKGLDVIATSNRTLEELRQEKGYSLVDPEFLRAFNIYQHFSAAEAERRRYC
jgi:ATP-dependent Clp protease ATP-binding subunit ClpA